jgi:hypothetical protein
VAERPPNAKTRRTDRGLRALVRENAYRDVWLIIITGLVLWSQIGQHDLALEQREGRKQAVDVTCAAVTAVIDAGRSTITGGTQPGSAEFVANLERLGYPPKPVREAQAEKAADAYARFISGKVESLTGARGVVNPDGSLNCEKFRELARVE